MLLQTIISLTVIIVLTIVMSLMLSKIVKRVKDQSREYFEEKIVAYDDIINNKEERLEKISSKFNKHSKIPAKKTIPSANIGNPVILNEKLPDYKINGFLRQAKIVEEKFRINKEQTVRSFISKQVNPASNEARRSLIALYRNLNAPSIYDRITNSIEDGWNAVIPYMDENAKKIMHDYIVGSPKANISEIIGYIQLEIDKAAPEILVETGERNDDFKYIYANIRTIYNPDIYLGLRIFYQDRMYDYSLKGEM